MPIEQYLKFVIIFLFARFGDFALSVVGRSQFVDSWLFNASPSFFFQLNEERNFILLLYNKVIIIILLPFVCSAKGREA